LLKSAELLFEKLDNVITEITSEDYDISLDCIDYMVADIESAKSTLADMIATGTPPKE